MHRQAPLPIVDAVSHPATPGPHEHHEDDGDVDDDAIAFQEVINANAHAIRSSEPKPTFFAPQNPDKLFKPTNDYVTTSVEGFALRKGNPAALAYFNEWIDKNKEWLKQRHTYWFKGRDWAANVPAS